jgi:magnesium-protoporphyrin O-methyltransferase
MSCEHCCGAQKLFDDKAALKEKKRYRTKGPRKTTRKLLAGLAGYDLNDLELLDIGGGIGVLQIELFDKGVASSTEVEASHAYLQTAHTEMQSRGLDSRTTLIEGDFLDRHQEVGEHATEDIGVGVDIPDEQPDSVTAAATIVTNARGEGSIR